MKIVFDTCSLREKGLYSREMLKLKELCSHGICTVAIPDIVRKEFIGNWVESTHRNLQTAYKGVRGLLKQIDKHSDYHGKTKTLEENIKLHLENLSIELNNEFDKWLSDFKGVVFEFSETSFNNVLHDYFEGKGAFKKVRNRNDFPDALIASTIQENANPEIDIIITNDKQLGNHLTSLGFQVYKHLSEFLEREEITSLLLSSEGMRKVANVWGDIVEFFLKDSFIGEVKRHLSSEFETIYIEPGDTNIQNLEKLKVEVLSVGIDGIAPGTIKDIIVIPYIHTEDCIFIEVTFTANALVRYCLNIMEYFSLLDYRYVKQESMTGHGVCEVSEMWETKITTMFNIPVDNYYECTKKGLNSLIWQRSEIEVTESVLIEPIDSYGGEYRPELYDY